MKKPTAQNDPIEPPKPSEATEGPVFEDLPRPLGPALEAEWEFTTRHMPDNLRALYARYLG